MTTRRNLLPAGLAGLVGTLVGLVVGTSVLSGSPPHVTAKNTETDLALLKTLNDLAAEAGLSLFHFIRAFHRRPGLTPHEYVVNVRIKHARQLLASGLPVARVAFQTGFADQSHLTRRFRASVGVTPGRYRSGG